MKIKKMKIIIKSKLKGTKKITWPEIKKTFNEK